MKRKVLLVPHLPTESGKPSSPLLKRPSRHSPSESTIRFVSSLFSGNAQRCVSAPAHSWSVISRPSPVPFSTSMQKLVSIDS